MQQTSPIQDAITALTARHHHIATATGQSDATCTVTARTNWRGTTTLAVLLHGTAAADTAALIAAWADYLGASPDQIQHGDLGATRLTLPRLDYSAGSIPDVIYESGTYRITHLLLTAHWNGLPVQVTAYPGRFIPDQPAIPQAASAA